jgi:hypothetical protein
MTHMTTEQLFETAYPELEIVGGRIQIKNGTRSISIENAFFMIALHGMTLVDILHELKASEDLARRLL